MDEVEDFLKAADALKVLEPRERQALEHKAKGHTRQMAANAMGLRRNTVRRMWQTSRQKLRAHLPTKLQKKFGAFLDTGPKFQRIARIGSLSDCLV